VARLQGFPSFGIQDRVMEGMIDFIAIIAALRHRKIAACLIVAEIAVAFAILSNALSLIGAEVERLTISSGTAESNLVDLFVNPTPGSDRTNSEAAMRQDVRALAGIAGVKAVSVLNQVPYGGGESVGGIDLKPDQHRLGLAVAMYLGNEGAIATLGLRLIAGRGFRADEMIPYSRDITPPVAILTRAAAMKLFGESNAVGRIVYHAMGRGKMTQVRVIGVVDKLVWPILLPGDTGEEEYSIIFPEWPSYAPQAHYLLRTSRAQMPRIEREAKQILAKSNPAVQVRWAGPLTELKSKYFRQERSMTWTLVAVCLALLIVTAAGIFGLTSVWMRERVHQIGIRRALGATRGRILAHYLLENLPLAAVGVLLGAALAFATSTYLLVHGYSLSRLPAPYVIVGAAVLLGLNQLAVLGPARRAAAIAPAEAARL